MGSPLLVLRYRSKAKEQFAAHNRKLANLGRRQTELNSRLDRSSNKLKQAEVSIARYDQFDQANANAELVALDAEIPIRQREHDALAERKERLDQQLEGAVVSLAELQSDLEHAKSRRNWLLLDVDRFEREIDKATKLDKQLATASDGRARWKIHQECEDEFDDGSPRRVLGDRRRKLNDARREISHLDRSIPAIERNASKAEQRVATIVARGTRDIRSIVIDGNNLCYQDAKFIGIAALRPLCLHLQENYEVTLIFDASIVLSSAEPLTRATGSPRRACASGSPTPRCTSWPPGLRPTRRSSQQPSTRASTCSATTASPTTRQTCRPRGAADHPRDPQRPDPGSRSRHQTYIRPSVLTEPRHPTTVAPFRR